MGEPTYYAINSEEPTIEYMLYTSETSPSSESSEESEWSWSTSSSEAERHNMNFAPHPDTWGGGQEARIISEMEDKIPDCDEIPTGVLQYYD